MKSYQSNLIMKKPFYITLLLLNTFFTCFSQLKSPSDFIPNYGKQITYYQQVEDYFNYLVSESKLIKKQKYGVTSEQRNLNLFFISSPENLANLEQIRNNNLASIGMSNTKTPSVEDKVIVWLSFNVHGNEFAGTESGLSRRECRAN